jgi:two-component system NarL family sensor kinase
MRADIDIAEMTAWADILSMIGQKNSRLYDLVERDRLSRGAAHRRPGRPIMEELERERSRIARELHAGAGQPLAGIKLNLETLDDCAAGLPPAGRDALVRLQTLADQALQQIRAVSHSLHPPDWQALSIADALRSLVQSSGLRDHVEVKLHLQPLPDEPSHAVKVALYRCAQECISNVTRHSGATRLMISLALVETDPDPARVELRLEDNGHGFPDEPCPTAKGIGLQAMREHATDLGGNCDISSGPEGVRICVRLPLRED